jgi:hypothetical protein
MHEIVRAMDVFPGEVSIRELTHGSNVMLSGEFPEAAIRNYGAGRLVQGVFQWKCWDAYHANLEESRT